MRISDWSSDVFSSDLLLFHRRVNVLGRYIRRRAGIGGRDFHHRWEDVGVKCDGEGAGSDQSSDDDKSGQDAGKERPVDEASHHRVDSDARAGLTGVPGCNLSMPATIILRSEEHKSELQSLMRISYAVFCL